MTATQPLAGRVAVVTGGGRGMGRSHCELLAERGARVVVCDLDADVAEKAATAIRASGGQAVAHAADVGDRAACEALAAAAVGAFGGIDVLVHNAGRLPCMARLAETEDDAWHAQFAVSVHGPMYLTRAALPHLRRSAAPRVIFVSSQWGQVGPGHSHAYVAAKTAMLGLARNLALELAPDGILVNTLAPGTVRTRMVSDGAAAELAGVIPLGRIAEPRELSYAVAFLASDEASFVTGQVVAVNGGALVG